MWDLLVSIPDHCLSFYFADPNLFFFTNLLIFCTVSFKCISI